MSIRVIEDSIGVENLVPERMELHSENRVLRASILIQRKENERLLVWSQDLVGQLTETMKDRREIRIAIKANILFTGLSLLFVVVSMFFGTCLLLWREYQVAVLGLNPMISLLVTLGSSGLLIETVSLSLRSIFKIRRIKEKWEKIVVNGPYGSILPDTRNSSLT